MVVSAALRRLVPIRSAENAIMCPSAAGYWLIDGEGFKASCCRRSTGKCMPIPGGADPLAFFCPCSERAVGRLFYVLQCSALWMAPVRPMARRWRSCTGAPAAPCSTKHLAFHRCRACFWARWPLS